MKLTLIEKSKRAAPFNESIVHDFRHERSFADGYEDCPARY